MQENNIYEIAMQMKNEKVMKNDIKEALGLVSNMFKNKYIDKIDMQFKQNVDYVKNNPTREIVLLDAIKPFINIENHKNIDNIINAFTNFSAINNILSNNYNTVQINKISKDPSIKEDGVYDIDENCLTYASSSDKNQNLNLGILLFVILFLKKA